MGRKIWPHIGVLCVLAFVAAACGSNAEDTTQQESDAATTTADTTATSAPTAAAGDSAAVGGVSDERCTANRDAGTVTFVTGFDYAAAAGIIDIISADAEGYFEELCIDVDIQPGFAPSNGALVIEGQAQFGMAGSFGELVANNLAGEGDLVAVIHWGRTAIEAIVLPEGSEVTNFSDLCGATIGIKGDLPYSLQAAIAKSGIERSCFDEILLDGFDPVAHLDLGLDALPVYKSNEPNALEAGGVSFTMLDPLDFDVPASFGITFTTQSFIDENPDLVQDVTRALLRGEEFAAENPDAAVAHAFDLIEAAGNPLFFAMEAESFRWGVESGLIADLTPAGAGIGVPDVELLGQEVDTLVSAGVFSPAPDWRSMVNADIAAGLYDGSTLVWPGG